MPGVRPILAAMMLIAASCGGVQHIGEYKPKERKYKSPVPLAGPEADLAAGKGSLFSAAQ